ncbi:MAG: single-stranded-DNA-specific exonuclease RecJ [Puniceicoccales bacterium]|nr:single-stranded-DNA-specific exonuclease RecJ [Puniceicoccales bacterium]
MFKWTYYGPPGDAASQLESALKLHPAIAETLAKRSISTAEAATLYLDPRLSYLGDPFLIANIAPAIKRIARALETGERIAIMGDYDVDGVTSTTFLVDILRALGAVPCHYVPRRLEEGYGMSRASIDRVLADGPFSLFIALDCGTNSVAEIQHLAQNGLDIIVIDHHRSKEPVSTECILVNPHVNDTGEKGAPWHVFCTVGLVFKVCHALLKHLRAQGNKAASAIVLREYLDLVAMGTIADLVPLKGENRLLTKHGLRQLRQTTRDGLRSLKKICGIVENAPVFPVDISFRLGPRINASGRLADALLPVEMLLTKDLSRSEEIAEALNAMNRERQNIERKVSEEALQQLEAIASEMRHALVAYGDWHPGVVGIVAGKLCRQFKRPCIVLGREGRWGKGSGRSVAGINLVEALQPCADILESWGGHPMAVGVTLDSTHVEALRERFNASVGEIMGQGTFAEETLELSSWLDISHVTEAFLDQLEQLQPFGEENPEPVFGMADITLRTPPVPFGESNYRFEIMLDSWRRLGVVAWRKADRLPPTHIPLNLAVKLGWNYFNGRRYPQAELLDWQSAGQIPSTDAAATSRG